MRKGKLSTILMSLLLLVPISAYSAPNEHLDWGAQLHSGSQSCPQGTLVINVVQKVINDADSGFGGYWALDDLVRQIKVIQTATNTFCATVSYQGNFTTFAGASPSGLATVGEGVVGTFEGGYTSTLFTGTLLASPLYRTKGSVGTFDYACDGTGNCPGGVDWRTFYFGSTSGFDLSWWGWVYHAGNNGSWTNASTGSSGDITGN